MAAYSLGIDVGSVSTNIAAIDEKGKVAHKLYLRTSGRPIDVMTGGLKEMEQMLGSGAQIAAVGATGSGRQLAGVITNADIIKNEITAHAAAAKTVEPEVKTIIEIGGQDSKIILLRNGVVVDFAMNTVCAAGTGSFIDRQASRLEIPIEEFGAYALRSSLPVRIAGRCAVFAESDMIHKQQMGACTEDIIRGLCEALVRNYLSNLAKNKEILEPVLFQGGVAANVGIVAAFERALGKKLVIPRYFDVMGAYGAAIIAKESVEREGKRTGFIGFKSLHCKYSARGIDCGGCSNMCEITEITSGGKVIARWGDRCGKWSSLPASEVVC